MTSWYRRALTRLRYWFGALKSAMGRLKSRPIKELLLPSELLPLLQVGTLAMRYSEFKSRTPESLQISLKLQELVEGKADSDTVLFVEKILFDGDLIDVFFTWLVFLGDAIESERESFKNHLQRSKQKEIQ